MAAKKKLNRVSAAVAKNQKRRKNASHKAHHPNAVKHKHYKPVRVRHLSVLTLGVVLFALSLLYLGADLLNDNFGFFRAEKNASTTVTQVSTGYGLQYSLDLNTVNVEAQNVSANGTVTELSSSDLRNADYVSHVVLRPHDNEVLARFAGSRMIIDVTADTSLFTEARATLQDQNLQDSQVAARLYELKSSNDFDVQQVSQKFETINGLIFTKTVYEQTLTSIASLEGVKTYTVQWASVVDNHAFAVTISGLISRNEIPELFASVLSSLRTDSDAVALIDFPLFSVNQPQVLGATSLSSSYVADLVSPAVVKIYKAICTDVAVNGQTLYDNYCTGGSGSGFILSADGYIATNGHVVVNEPADIFVEVLISHPEDIYSLLIASGYSQEEALQVMSSPDFYSALIANIYESQKESELITLLNKQESIFVSLGETPVNIDSPEEFFSQDTGDDIVEAELVDYDYKFSDLFNDTDEGFTASDVALLKIDKANTPLVEINSSSIQNSQNIFVIGFPGDAENALVNNDKLAATITDGSISSVREASGNSATVYQTNADASHGNSGGPAITEEGKVFGLLTYVYQSASAEDSAKTYIRSIDDVTSLLDDNSVTLDTNSDTQKAWQKGLESFSTQHFSKAIPQFEKVQELYPAHRLAASYIANAEKEIAAGNDIKDFPVMLLALGAVGGLVLVGGATVFILRHRKHHEVFKQTEQQIAAGTAQPYQPPTPQFPTPGATPPASTPPTNSTPPPVPQPGQTVQSPNQSNQPKS